ncbi:hypothetical protein DFQ28_008319 [Apophysomyces sp. BC1034]|nr:hypothetical protein DFQ28_008319 [Apophysomyces sp. BC1034]
MQLALGETVSSTSDKIPTDLGSSWRHFKNEHLALEEAPLENFENRVCGFVEHQLSVAFPNLKKWEMKEIVSKYEFERVAGGTPEWPDAVEPNLFLVAIIDKICDDLEQRFRKYQGRQRAQEELAQDVSNSLSSQHATSKQQKVAFSTFRDNPPKYH